MHSSLYKTFFLENELIFNNKKDPFCKIITIKRVYTVKPFESKYCVQDIKGDPF